MSGGFFRGTSADQDTRFSNKQAKLLKSQKFAPELDHLVDMTKVQMDVVKPWIAMRATELLGFEDEVLINFIYGLLDGKVVDGKQIQIQLTGFMEKNTGKFMRELWGLLLSAQENASGVPQQFLDAKEEETRKKKVESDRITQEIQKKKEREGRELEQEKQIRMDGETDVPRHVNAAADAAPKHSVTRASSADAEEERELNGRRGSRIKSRLHSASSHSDDRSPLSQRSTLSATKSSSISFSNSRSYSEEGCKSRRVSVSPSPQRRPPSHERRYRSPPRRSVSPRRKNLPLIPWSPSRRRSPHLRRRSTSRSRRRSPSPVRRRSPVRVRRRSPSPLRWRSPLRRRSPVKFRRRSPSPSRHRSPSPRRSSPSRRRSPSPMRRRSPLPRSPKYRRRSPLHSPRRHAVDSRNRSRSPYKNRNRSPYRNRSPACRNRRSLSRDHDSHVNGVESRRYRDDYGSQRIHGRRSPVRHPLERAEAEQPDSGCKAPNSLSQHPPISLRSPQRDLRDQSKVRSRVPVLSVPSEMSPNPSNLPSHMRSMNTRGNRTLSSSESPIRQTREQMACRNSQEASQEEENSHTRVGSHHKVNLPHKKSKYSPTVAVQKKFYRKGSDSEEYSPERLAVKQSADGGGHPVNMESRKDHEQKSDMELSQRHTQQVSHLSEEVEYGPGAANEENLSLDGHNGRPSIKQLARGSSVPEERPSKDRTFLKRSYLREGYRSDDKKRSRLKDNEYSPHHEKDYVPKTKKLDKSDRMAHIDSDSEENETYRSHNMDKRSSKNPEHQKMVLKDEDGYDSQIDGRKEAKRRRKEEKRLQKEEKHRRREERHRRKEERRAGKLKAKYMDTVSPPSDYEKNCNAAFDSDGDAGIRRASHPSDIEETESEHKKLEIELRKKALESLRAKKAIH